MYVLLYGNSENDISVHLSSLPEVEAWLKKNGYRYDYNLDNVEVFEVSTVIDVYSLMEDQ